MTLSSEVLRIAGVELELLRPDDPEALIDEQAFADRDEFLPYWSELWPSGLELAEALPAQLGRVVELGAGLGIPSLVAAARGADVTAVDWAPEAIELLQQNAARNNLSLQAVAADWRDFDGSFDLVLAADVLYEQRNVAALLAALPRLAPSVLLADPGRPHAACFFTRAEEQWHAERVAARVHRLTRTID